MNEIGLREGRAKFGDLVNRAEYAGEITYITRHGRRVAAIVPINFIAQELAMTVSQSVPANLEDRWFTAAARTEFADRGSNADAYASEFGEEQLAQRGREGILAKLYLMPTDNQWMHVHADVWDLDQLAGQGWTEYPVPGPGRVFVKPDEGAMVVHSRQSYIDEEVPEQHIPKSNTVDGEHVVIRRIGKKSAPLVAAMLTTAAATVEG